MIERFFERSTMAAFFIGFTTFGSIMKTDDQLKEDVIEELRWESMVTSTDIRVAAHHGVVTLSGSVPHYAEKAAAERAVQRVAGVKAIAEEMDVNLNVDHHHSDAAIAEAVVSSLKWHVWVPKGVQATVENGWVTLSGDARFEFERTAAMEAVKYVSGVKGVFSKINLKPIVQAAVVKHEIEKALKRDAEIDAEHVMVSANGGKVTLTGTIRSWDQRDEAGAAAWNAPGVTEVQNNLAILERAAF